MTPRLTTLLLPRQVIVLLWLWLGLAGAYAGETALKAEEIARLISQSSLQDEILGVMELELPSPADEGLDDFKIEPSDRQSFAIDGSGGWYYVLGDGRILMVESEGTAGVVAPDFETFLAIATGLPGWRDALRFVGEADLETARAAWLDYVRQWDLDAAMDKPWPYYPEQFSIATPGLAREAIRAEFGISAASDPFAALYQAVNMLNGDVKVAWQGADFEIFGAGP